MEKNKKSNKKTIFIDEEFVSNSPELLDIYNGIKMAPSNPHHLVSKTNELVKFDDSAVINPHTIYTGMSGIKVKNKLTERNNKFLEYMFNHLSGSKKIYLLDVDRKDLELTDEDVKNFEKTMSNIFLDENFKNKSDSEIEEMLHNLYKGTKFDQVDFKYKEFIRNIDNMKARHKITIGKTRYGMTSALYSDLFDTYNGVERKQIDFKYNEYLFPNLSGQAISLFGNELIIYSTKSTTQSHKEFIEMYPDNESEFLNSIKEYHRLVGKSIFELLEKDFDINVIYVEKGVGVIKHLDDYYKNDCFTKLLRNDDIEDLNILTSKKVICFDCTAIKEPHLILKNKFENKKLILIVDIKHFSIINQHTKDLVSDIINEIDLSILPTEEEFKKRAWKIKEEQGIKLTAALNELSKKYGYSCFNAIKPQLLKK